MAANVVVLPVDILDPNDYNPNVMTEAETEELIGEVRHLGRLPKPVIVRQNGDRYTIVDGEHCWRAACEVGLSEVPCEVINADDFEAMRQTYKRNQHGTHNPVLLGQMFKRMMEDRCLSQRALAAEINVSEGTVRNALLYADAAALRNSYAFDKLTIRQVRAYLGLPVEVGNVWLDAGADLAALSDSTRVKIRDADGNEKTVNFDFDWFPALVEAGLACTLDSQEFVQSVRRAFQLLNWQQGTNDIFPGLAEYVQVVAQLRLPVDVLDKHLKVIERDGEWRLYPPVDEWHSILSACQRKAENPAEIDSMVAAAVRMSLRRISNGDDIDVSDPRTAEALELLRTAPGFIRDADIPLADKWRLFRANADVPPDVLLEAKRRACKELCSKYGLLSSKEMLTVECGMTEDQWADMLQRWAGVTAETALNRALQHLQRDACLAEREAVFGDRSRLMNEVEHRLIDRCGGIWGTAPGQDASMIGSRRAVDVFKERLAGLPEPEFKLLAAFVLGEELMARSAALSFWLRAAEAEYAEAEARGGDDSAWDGPTGSPGG